MDLPTRSARSGSADASASTTVFSAHDLDCLSVMELAACSASAASRAAPSGSATATSVSAHALECLSVMELAACSASVSSRAARSGSFRADPVPPQPGHLPQLRSCAVTLQDRNL